MGAGLVRDKDSINSLTLQSLFLSRPVPVTILSGVITVTQSSLTVDTESAAASDDLDTIKVFSGTDLLFLLRATSDSHSVVIKHNTGNILCVGNADITLDDQQDFAICRYDSSLQKVLAFGAGASPSNALLDGVNHTDTTNSGVTRGDLIYGNSTPAWDDLAIGAAGKYLRSDGTDPSWQSLGRQFQLAASTMNVHATNAASPNVYWVSAVGGVFTCTAAYDTLPTSAVAQTWILQRSAAGGAYSTVVTFAFPNATPMVYNKAGDMTITVAQFDKLRLIHTVGDNSGVGLTVGAVEA